MVDKRMVDKGVIDKEGGRQEGNRQEGVDKRVVDKRVVDKREVDKRVVESLPEHEHSTNIPRVLQIHTSMINIYTQRCTHTKRHMHIHTDSYTQTQTPTSRLTDWLNSCYFSLREWRCMKLFFSSPSLFIIHT